MRRPRILASLLASTALVIGGVALAPAAQALAMTPDTGLIAAGGYDSFDVLANDAPPAGAYIDLGAGADPRASTWGDVVNFDASSSTASETLTVPYDVFNSSGSKIGSSTLTVDVLGGAPSIELTDHTATITWDGLPAGVDGLRVTYAQDYVGSHSDPGSTVTGTSPLTIGGLTNDQYYYFYVTAYDGAADQSDYSGTTLQGSPRATNVAPVAHDDNVSIKDLTTQYFDPTSNDTDDDYDQLTVVSHTSPSNGDLTCDQYGCAYTPHSLAADSFDYTVSDSHGGTATATVHVITRSDVVLRADSLTFPADEDVVFSPTANDTGIVADDQVDLSMSSGAVSYYNDYDGNPQDFIVNASTAGTYTGTYSVTSANGVDLGSRSVTFTVTARRPFITFDDDAWFTMGEPDNVEVGQNDRLAPDSFPLNSSATASKITVQPLHGTASLGFDPGYYQDGTTLVNLPIISYQPDLNWHGTDTLTYQLTDAQGRVDTAQVTLTTQPEQLYIYDVTPDVGTAHVEWGTHSSPNVDAIKLCYSVGTNRTDDPPVPTMPCEHEVALGGGTPTSVDLTGLTNDVRYTLALFTHSSDGTPDGIWAEPDYTSFRPGVGSVRDVWVEGGSTTATFTWANPSNSAGTTVALSLTAPPDTPTGGTNRGTAPAGATTKTFSNVVAGKTYYYSVFATNGTSWGDPETGSFTTRATNAVPVLGDDSASVNQNDSVDIGVSANDSDADGDPMTVRSTSTPSHGDAYCYDGGSGITCSYYPDFNYAGQDTFTYTVSDGHFGVATATVTVTVVDVPEAPVAFDGEMEVTQGINGTIDLKDYSYDNDAGDTLTWSTISQPASGSVSCVNATGICTFKPGNPGTYTWGYRVKDQTLRSDTGLITVTVVANNPPVVTQPEKTVAPGNSVSIDLTQFATDPDGDTMTYAMGTDGAKGHATCTTAGSCTYTANAGATGDDSFGFTVTDAKGAVTNGSALIHIVQPNRAPVTTDASYDTDNHLPVTVDLAPLTTDPDGDTLTFSKVGSLTPAGAGSVTCTGAGSCTYTPNNSFVGTATFDYKANDGHLDSNVSTITVNVSQANRAPVAVDDSGTVRQGGSVGVNVAANDTDADLDTLTFAKASDPAHGTATCTSAGVCTYTAAASYAGTDSFTYTVSDGKGGTDTGTVTMTVTANHAPTVGNDSLTVVSGAAGSVNVAANDSDADGDTLTYALGTAPAHGSAACTAAGSCSYTSAADYAGSDSFTYTVSDGHGGSKTGTVSVTVNPATVQGTATITREGPAKRSVKTKLVVSGKATPAKGGSTVQLQRLDGTTWTTVATGTEASDGSYSVAVKQSTGSFKFRVHIPAAGNRSEITTGTVGAKFYQVAMPGGSTKAADQFVTVKNTGAVAVSLKGWLLTIKSSGAKLTLPKFTLKPGKSVKIHLGKGTSDGQNLYLKSGKTLTKHDTVKLKDLKPVTVASLGF